MCANNSCNENGRRNNGFAIVLVLFILLAIIFSSTFLY